MKKFFLIAALTVVAMVSSTRVQSSASKSFVGVETTVNSLDEKYEYPIYDRILIDDFWIETLSDSIDYLVLPSDFQRTPEVDSLVDFYNIVAASNALNADLFLQTRGYLASNEMPIFDDSRVLGTSMAGALHNLARTIRRPYNPDEEEAFWDELYSKFGELNESLSSNYLDVFSEKIDTHAMAKAMDESQYVADIASIANAIKDGEINHQRILDLCLGEKYFIPQTVLARQYSLACYAQRDANHTRPQATGLLQSLMETGIYSPFLPEIWRMWRCRIQNDALSISNDGVIQNHLYNKMRNRVALTLLREYSSDRKSDALVGFINLAIECNIIRRGSLIGNYATVEDMDLFWSKIESDQSDEEIE